MAAPTQTPDKPVRPRRMMNTLVAVVVGGMLAVGAVFTIEHLDVPIKTPGDMQAVLSMPTLGSAQPASWPAPGRSGRWRCYLG